MDLRGKVLRIKPKPIADGATLTTWGPGITYDIPAGNLFPVGTAKNQTRNLCDGRAQSLYLNLRIPFDMVRVGEM